LADLTVLDLSRGIAGPLTGMLMADQGARVIKVEPPGGDPTRRLRGARVWNRGKESVVLDLSSIEDSERLWSLIDRADVLIETAGAESMGRLGLGFDDVHRRNPRLVFCSITGYGDLARHAGRWAYDALVAARTGLQWEKRGWPGGSIERINGIEPFLPDDDVPLSEMEGPPRGGPLFSAVPWPSMSAFHLASIGISAALYTREVTGRGQQVTTSLLQGALVNGTFTWQRAERPDRRGYRMWVTDPRVPHGFFQTADGGWVHHWTPQPGFVLTAAGGDRLDASIDGRTLKTDGSRVGMDPEELVVLRETLPAMRAAFGRFSTQAWIDVAARAGVSVQPVRSPEDALFDPLFLSDGCVVEIADPDVGPIRQVGLTYHLHATPSRIRGPAPRVGEHTGAVIAELDRPIRTAGPAPVPAVGVPEAASPLDGVVVLDLGLAIAGPFGAQMLADLGADVIKVNRLSDQAWMDTYMGMCCNRGKRSIALELKSAAGMEVLRALVERADVVHTNMRYDAAEKLGVDYESLRRANPRIVYCHTRGFENGPRMLLPGHDQSASALAGVAWEEGGVQAGGKPIWPNLSLGDTGNGMLSATAVLQALWHRRRTGEGQFVDTSIMYAHLLNASASWTSADRTNRPDRPRLDALTYGLSALYRLYETRDGWTCLAVVTDGQWQHLCRAMGLDSLLHDPRFDSPDARVEHDAELGTLLETAFAGRSAAEWSRILDDAGVPAETSSDTFALGLFDDPELIDRGWVVALDHPLVGKVEMFGHTIGFSETPGRIERPPIVVGQHTRQIMIELGYAPPVLDALIAEGVIAEAGPTPGR